MSPARATTAAFLLLAAIAGCQRPESLPIVDFVTNGPVYAVVRSPDGGTYIGGAFSQVDPPSGGGVALDLASGRFRDGSPFVDGTVKAVIPDGSGGWYIGGAFSHVGAVERGRLAAFDAFGNLTAWSPSANDRVLALAIDGETVYAGGTFTAFSGGGRTTPRMGLAAFDAGSGDLPTSFDPSPNGPVFALAARGGTIYVGGQFFLVGAEQRTRTNLAALDASGHVARSPNPDHTVNALATAGGLLYVGGSFQSIGGVFLGSQEQFPPGLFQARSTWPALLRGESEAHKLPPCRAPRR